ncbi:MAG: PTS transporter subunit IIB [Gemmatimonadales bacterium]|nr:PTS transporter subunit IIB [Gemmatimonadales bacterium]NIN12811.1 PTS transporter subunit IIB [Gemmatimonadales bacterium]NIN48739.1 PTS transporter subunit IIB [Gemmatimonadales bacterium]NIP06203.1 PTS transporter subunit IIB [Gemmatimonadales bacterium]NIR01388.1 PTS transporter subunit IIB [Gemmatimonadales bacterium]
MSISLVRVDDRLIHGQVVVGWVQALGAKRIVLVDDAVRANEWEQELYRLGVPSGLKVEFKSVDEAADAVMEWAGASERTIVLVADVTTIVRLCGRTDIIEQVNIGGLHDGTSRSQRLSYVYLSEHEAKELSRLDEGGVKVTAQDVPTARVVPLRELL